MSTRDEFIKKLHKIDGLPTLPIVMSKLTKALGDTNCNATSIEQILLSDPAISTQLLKTVNSPLYAAKGAKVADLRMAVTRLGFREVKNIVLSTSVFKMFDGVKSKLFDRQSFWKHCMTTSQAAIEIGKLTNRRLKRDELHLAGLVHDIGKIILDSHFSEEFEQCLQLAYKGKIPLCDAEELVLGINHAEIGFILAEKWNLPDYAANAIRYHHTPDKAPEEFAEVVNTVHMANYLVNSQDLGTSGDFVVPVFNKCVLESSNITAEIMQEVVETLIDQEEELMESLS
jgi:putative nucleotidyltransferase with HDIG domain